MVCCAKVPSRDSTEQMLNQPRVSYRIRLIRCRTATNQPDQRECFRIHKDNLLNPWFCQLTF